MQFPILKTMALLRPLLCCVRKSPPENNGPHSRGPFIQKINPLTRPGLGFEIDKGLLKRYGTRFLKITETRLELEGIREKGLKAALAIKKRKGGSSSV